MQRQSSGKVRPGAKIQRLSERKNLPVIAVLGYGGQGRALAFNWRDSGYSVLVGLRPKSMSTKFARADGFPVVSIRQAAVLAEVVVFAIPDHAHAKVFETSIRDRIESNTLLLFLHGTSIAFGGVKTSAGQSVGLLAPHAPGVAVRSSFEKKIPLSGFISGNSAATLARVRRLAEAMGTPKSHQMETSMHDEAIGDLFGEQTVLCGGLAALVTTGFETLVNTGLNPKQAWLEVGYQLDLIVALLKEHGVAGMFERISVAAQHGSAEIAPVLKTALKPIMQKRLREIANGSYPRRLFHLSENKKSSLSSKTRKISSDILEKAAYDVAQLTKYTELDTPQRSLVKKQTYTRRRS